MIWMFRFLPLIINVKMLSIYILIKSWAPWSNIHSLECKGPKINPDSRHFIFFLSVASGPGRYQHFRKRKQLETTPVGLGQAGSCQFTLKLDQIWEGWDNGQWQILVSVCQDWHQCHCQCQPCDASDNILTCSMSRATQSVVSCVVSLSIVQYDVYILDLIKSSSWCEDVS